MADKEIKEGESTGQQSKYSKDFGVGLSMSALPGYPSPEERNYEIYRRISAHPTVALAMSIVTSPIVGGTWNWAKRDEDVSDDVLEFCQGIMDPLRNDLVSRMLKALSLGWTPFEVCWENTAGETVIKKVKPLLQEITEPLVDEHGNLIGIENNSPNLGKKTLDGPKYFVYTYDSSDGNPLGRSRHDNILKEWTEAEYVRRKMAQYLSKIASVIVQLHYPEGTMFDESGAPRSAAYMAQRVLDAVSEGKSVMLPNLFASTVDVTAAAELAGKSSWVLSALEVGGTDYAPGMQQVLEYYDALFFRGWLRPERVGLEGTHGTKAEAQAHTDTGTLDCELIDRDICHAINEGLLNNLLELNFGKAFRGAVYIEAAPIEDDNLAVFKDVLDTLLANQTTANPTAKKIDIDGILDALNVPVEDEMRGPLGDEVVNQVNKQENTVDKEKE